jgi:hypothetical protein
MHLTNVQAMPAPRLHSSQMQYGVSIRELVRLYDHGLVLDFQTLQWAFTPYGENKLSQWSDWNMSTSTILFHRVRARLIDLDPKEAALADDVLCPYAATFNAGMAVESESAGERRTPGSWLSLRPANLSRSWLGPNHINASLAHQ